MNSSEKEFYRYLRLFAVTSLMALTFIVGLKYSLNRHFQPDEFVLSKSINMLNFPEQLRDIIYIQFYMIPLSAITNLLSSSKEILQFLRIFFLVILLLNIFIMSNFSLKRNHFYAKILILVFLLAQYPLWRLGIEIRHEVIILLGLVCSSSFFIKFLKSESANLKLIFLTGLFTGLVAQTAYKGLIYSIGLSAIILICLLLKNKLKIKESVKPFLYYLSGYLIFSVFAIVILAISGHLDEFFNIYKSLFGQSLYQRNFFPTEIFKDLVTTAPMTILLAIVLLFNIMRRFKFFSYSKDLVPIFTLGQICFFTLLLFLSPVPFRYNIIVYISTILIFIVHQIDYDWINKNKFNSSVLIAINLIIFVYSAGQDYYLRYTNKYQLDYIKTAEELSSQGSRIIDAMGIVATRPATRKDWAIYFAQMPKYMAGEFEFFSDAFLTKTPEIAITNYRWKWLRKEDHQVLNDRYMQIGEHMWILGGKVKQKKGTFKIHKAGRYKILKNPKQSKFLINNKSITESIVFLEKGTFQFENQGGPASILWLGPKAKNVPYLFIHKKQPFIVPIQ